MSGRPSRTFTKHVHCCGKWLKDGHSYFLDRLGKGRRLLRMMGLQKRLQRYYLLNQQGINFNDEIKEVKEEMQEIADIKSMGVILRSREKRERRR